MNRSPNTARLDLRIPDELRADLERLAVKQSRPLSNMVRFALKQYVEAEGIRESLARGHE